MICMTTYSDEYLGSSDSSDFGDDHDIISSNNKLNDDGWARDKSIYIKILIHPGLKNCEHILDLFSKKVMRNDNPEGQYGQIVCM